MKALELLKEIRNIETNFDHLKWHRFDEAIMELEKLQNRSCEIAELQTKLQSLESYCEEQKDTWESQENGNHKVYEKILIKLKDKQ